MRPRSDASLEKLGYAQELLRAMGGFSSFALSFSIISVVTGVTSTYGDAVRGGGGAALGLGWPLVCAGTLLVALGMAELASAFPTAGAVYHWAALLGGAGWGWLAAMMNLVAMVSIVGAIDLTCAEAIAATLGLEGRAASLGIFFAILFVHALLNVVSVRLVAWLNDFSATVHIVGVVVLVGALLVLGRAHGPAFLLDTSFTAREDGRYGLGFVSALVLGMWTFTGFDASAHAAEETNDPARRAPWGIVSAVVVSAVAGFALVVALTLAMHQPSEVAAEKDGALFVLRHALGDGWGRAAMGLAIVAMGFCGLSSVTSASRTLYAFARDGGVPFASFFRKVSPRWKTPVEATIACAAAPAALILAITPLSGAVFLAVATLTTIAFYVSYALPLALGAVARARGRWRTLGPWNLRRGGVVIAWAGVAWSAFVVAVCVFANPLSGALFVGVCLALAVLWLVAARTRFKGPAVSLGEYEQGVGEERE